MQKNEHLWNEIWSKQETSSFEYKKSIRDEMRSVRWRRIEKEVLNKWKSFKGLKVVELGAGRGVVSLIMKLKGADATLIDFSEVALERAQLVFRQFNCDAKFLKADVLNLPHEVLDQFDISMSFGLAEHFVGEARQQVVSSHYCVLKNNGISFISVPNKLCLPYRILKKMLELRHVWIYGTEEPFTHSELRKKACFAEFKSCKIIGSSFINAIDRFSLVNVLSKIGINTEMPSFLDNYFGYALILVGYKS